MTVKMIPAKYRVGAKTFTDLAEAEAFAERADRIEALKVKYGDDADAYIAERHLGVAGVRATVIRNIVVDVLDWLDVASSDNG